MAMSPRPATVPSVERGERRLLQLVSVLLVIMACTFVWMMGRPVYWYLLSEVIHPSPAQAQPMLEPSLKLSDTGASVASPIASLAAGDIRHSRTTPSPSPAASQPGPVPPGPDADKMQRMRAETAASLHGVATDPTWQARRPRNVSDEDLQEKDYILDRDTMHKIADKDRYIMVTWANDHYYDFVKNWVEHVEALGVSSFAVGAMDNMILGRLVRAGVPCFAMQSGLTHKDFGWGSKNFHIMGRKKIKLVQLFTEMGLTVIVSDVDTLWMRNPFEYGKRYPEADILTSSDAVAWTFPDEGLEDMGRAGAAYNIGIMLFSPRSAAFAREWVDVIESDADVWDQNAFNQLVRRGMRKPADGDPLAQKRLFLGDNGKLVVGILPVALFASGHAFFVSRLHEQLRLDPYVVHATFQFSGTPGKRNRLRESMLWNDPPEYYDHAVGFVAWDMDVPKELLAKAAPNPESLVCCEAQQGHFDLVNHQLLQTRHALAIASVLGRGVVIPQFVAGQDRWWAPHSGRIPGARTLLPYRAPIDHILDLERGLVKELPPDEFGPDIPYREHSFLANPRMPAVVRDSVVVVEVCGPAAAGAACADGSGPAPVAGGRVRIQGGLNDAQIRTALGGVNREYKVLKFTSMVGAFGRHVDDKDHDRFVKRTRHMASIWCCVVPDPGKPGHVWYDMWWDTVPHTDLHNRVWNEPWTIKTGP